MFTKFFKNRRDRWFRRQIHDIERRIAGLMDIYHNEHSDFALERHRQSMIDLLNEKLVWLQKRRESEI